MSEMLERVARAIVDTYRERVPASPAYDDLSVAYQVNALACARAAIAAMREPTQEMRTALWDCLEKNASVGNCRPGHIRGNGMPDVFLKLFVDEALKL